MQLLALNYGSPVNVKRSDLTDQQIGHYANHLEEIYDQMKRFATSKFWMRDNSPRPHFWEGFSLREQIGETSI